MLKVECESCKAPYQIDERRVPPTGLKMRCPKCGHSFLVTNPGAAPAAPPPGPQATGSGGLKRTMVGVAPPPAPVGVPAPSTAAAPRPAPRPPTAAPAAPPVALPLTPMRAQLPSDFPAALGALDEGDLPVVSAGLPVVSAGLPARKAAAGPTAAPAAKAPPVPAPVVRGSSFGDIELDLPVVSAGLPVVSAGLPSTKVAPKPPARSAAGSAAPAAPARPPTSGAAFSGAAFSGAAFDLDLPARVSDLPSLKHGGDVVDLPMIASDLPVPAAGLPVVAADLPSPAAGLPQVAAGLPVPASALPVFARGFGEIDLPNIAEVLPTVAPTEQHLPSRSSPTNAPASAAFGEIELPRERASSSAPPAASAVANSADFGDLDFGNRPASVRSPPALPVAPHATHASPTEGSAMTFGEVDFGGGDGARPGAGSIGVDAASAPLGEASLGGPGVHAAATAPVSMSFRNEPMAPRERPAPPAPRRSYGKLVAGGLFIAALLAGGTLQLTKFGAFGYLAVGDALHSGTYERATSTAVGDAEKTLGADDYAAAKSAVEGAYAAHVATPRARPLTAYAAVVDAATSLRFGGDPGRTSRTKQLLGELPPGEPVKYLDVAQAAQAAADGELDKARRGLDAASKHDPGDPIQVEVALLRGGVELAARDGAAALVAFKHAVELSNDARGHFGLARAYERLGDAASARRESDATLLLAPQHVGALVLRARLKGTADDAVQSLAALGKMLDGPARAKASPDELSRAYAAKAWIQLDRGAASEARDAFAQAVKINPRNVEALNGEGRLLLGEGRFTEALSRFDTALQYDAASPDTIANDAEAKIALERLADAKQQLLDAKPKFPKSIALLLLLGKVEQHLGNKDAAETDLRAAVALVDPTRPDAVLPYVALSELLSARGRLADASAVLEDARKALPASATLERAFGEVSELQGDYDTAIADYKSALTKDPKEVATHFRLAVVLRRVRKFDAAGAELDNVAAVDKDYPGLSLERGLLFEESGDVQKAIEQFKGALAKAPNDPDLQLRVGSAYVVIGRPDDALPMLRKVLQNRPTSAEAHHYIGRALMLKGRSDQVDALRYLKKAVDLDPNRAEFHVYLAWAANDAQPAQLEMARDEIDKALALDKQSAEAYWQKGVLERMEGAIDDAIRDEKHTLALRPSRYEAHATLAECLEDKNDQAGAAAEWSRAIAGDGNIPGADGTVPHPYWRYRYGKLLLEHGNTGAALAPLLASAVAGEKMDQRPGWMGSAEFLAAEALRKSGGHNAEAIEHYRRFLEIAPVNSPDRADAQAALARLAGSPR